MTFYRKVIMVADVLTFDFKILFDIASVHIKSVFFGVHNMCILIMFLNI